MVESVAGFLDSVRLLVDLQRVSDLVQSLSGCLEAETIAKRTTDGFVKTFDCAFARIWLVEPDQASLRLVASSGMYTRTDGFFGKVPMGAFKVGKIAQNRIPFLSNHLADEPWVKDREWAIAHSIIGFAGYPLMVGERVIGVLAVFSHYPLSSEFLEVLQGLCATLAILLENALQYQQEKQSRPAIVPSTAPSPLSERLAALLNPARLTLVGTERSLPPSLTCLLTRTAEVLRELGCTYCRLTYSTDQIALEAMVAPSEAIVATLGESVTSIFEDLLFAVSCLGGSLQTVTGENQAIAQVVLQVPYPTCKLGPRLRIQCQTPVLQLAFTHLAALAGITLGSAVDSSIPLLTDDPALLELSDYPFRKRQSNRVLWIAHPRQSRPRGTWGSVDFSISPATLRSAVETVLRGEVWSGESEAVGQSLSEREQEILRLLAQGLRDRDIAKNLHISERTVKFHINNVLTKLNVRTRCQAMYQAAMNGLGD